MSRLLTSTTPPPKRARNETTRELPLCPFAGCENTRITGASGAKRYEYNCVDCNKTWYQTRPDALETEEDPDVREKGVRGMVYNCKLCGLPKKGHLCTVKPRKSPSSTGKYACGKCGKPKLNHICSFKETDALVKSIEKLTGYAGNDDIDIYSILDDDYDIFTKQQQTCGICTGVLENDILPPVECTVCRVSYAHMHCIADLSAPYKCMQCSE